MKHALPHLIATLAAAAIALPAVAGPEAACGSLEWNYGPSGRNGITDLPWCAPRPLSAQASAMAL